tara:strand:+ start:514 stop:1182 length:669 start_codon:yes stop_codon:yes gene_type:complete
MGKIANQYFEGGQAPTAAQLNAVYNSVASSSVQDVNINTEWAQRKHFSGSNRITSLYTFDYDGTADWATSSTTFTTIENVSGTQSKVLPNYTTHGNVIVRVHASGLIAESVLSDAGDGNGQSGQTNYNTFAFRLFMGVTAGGSATTVDVANCTYSFTGKAAITNRTTSTAGKIYFRNFCFSGLATLSPNVVIDSIELQACVGYASNTVNIQHNHIQVIVVEN